MCTQCISLRGVTYLWISRGLKSRSKIATKIQRMIWCPVSLCLLDNTTQWQILYDFVQKLNIRIPLCFLRLSMCLLNNFIYKIYQYAFLGLTFYTTIEKINNITRYNLINRKYHQMALRSARWRFSCALFGNPWSNKSYANVEDFDCTVQMLLFFSI